MLKTGHVTVLKLLYLFNGQEIHAGAYLGEIAPMTNTELAPLPKQMTPNFFITITKKIMIMQLRVAKYYYS